ncbi:MAG TPA: fibronectin type III domain-containing protein [Mycobacteriales bacterium]|nr:fibronectin type III domain-containing protein [Mycobacteriales bacterium]
MPRRLSVWSAALSLACAGAFAVVAPGGVSAAGTISFGVQLRSLGQAQSPPLRSVPAKPVAAGRTGAFPYRPVPHRHVPGQLATDVATTQTSAATSTAAPATGSGFAGNSNSDLVLPPDTNGDIGYDASGNAWYVQWVNLHYQAWERPAGQSTWTSKLTTAGNTVFANLNNLCSSTNDGDPQVVYDRLARRWVLTQFAFDTTWPFGAPTPPYGQCVAVSQTSDPTGAYNVYSWDVGNFNGTDYFPDYPKLGVWPNGYYLTFNYFSGNNLSTFNGAGLVILDRTAMLNGQSAQANASGPLASTIASMLPVSVDDNSPPDSSLPETLVAVDTNSTAGGSHLQWWHVSNVTWGSNIGASLDRLPDMTVATYNWDLCNESRNCIPQPGTSAGLDTLSDRLMYRAGYRTVNGVSHVVLNQTVNVASSGTQAAIRWYDITNVATTPTLAQQGTYAPDADNRWMGSAAMDSAGDVAIGYSVSSSSTYPSIRFAGRAPGDTPGTLGAESTLKAGAGSQTDSSNRWGDYSSLVVDPVDGCTFWYTNEYYSSTAQYAWKTWIGSFTFPGCGGTTVAPPAAPASASAAAVTDTSDQIAVSWSSVAAASDYVISRDGAQVADVTTTSWTDSGLLGSSTHTYCIYAHNSGGSSSTCAGTGNVTTNPPAPTGVSATAVSGTEIDLQWLSATGAATYNVERATTSTGPWGPPIATGITGTTFANTGLATGTTYYYRLRSVASGGGIGSASSVVSATAGKPGAFTLTGTATSPNLVTLSWSPWSSSFSYTAYRRSGSKGSFTVVQSCSGVSAGGCTDSSVKAGTSYSYYVTATGPGGQTNSNTVTVKTPRH